MTLLLTFDIDVEIFPAFGYGQDSHETTLLFDQVTVNATESKVATFHSKDVQLRLDVVVDSIDGKNPPVIQFTKAAKPGMHGEGLIARVEIKAGQALSFVVRNDLPKHVSETITTEIIDQQQHDTLTFWQNFIAQSKYKGRWIEVVSRSLMILKMMTYGKKSRGL